MEMSLCLALLAASVFKVQCSTVYFEPGNEYRFNYNGYTEMTGVGTFFVDSKIGISQIGFESNEKSPTQHCSLTVHYFNVRVQRGDEVDENVNTEAIDFTKWFSFHLDAHGHIDQVFYEVDNADLFAIELKKKILSVLSNKLMISEESLRNGTRWAYATIEDGQQGADSLLYQAEPQVEHRYVIFKKKKLAKDVDTMGHSYEKEITYDSKLSIPRHSKLSERFKTTRSAKYKRIVRNDADEINKLDSEYGFPVMQGSGSVTLSFDRPVKLDEYGNGILAKPLNLASDTLRSSEIQKPLIDMSKAAKYIQGNVSCMHQNKEFLNHGSRMQCFHDICNVMRRVSADDLKLIVNKYQNVNNTAWTIVIDALGATQTNATLELLTELVIAGDDETFNITMRALAQFISMEQCPPMVLCNMLQKRVLRRPWKYEDKHETNLVNERAILVLGSLARAMRQCNSTWSHLVTTHLKTLSEIHDPYQHRMKRSQLSKSDFKRHVSMKAVHIMALANDRHPSSFEYFQSYVNDTTSHIQLRCCAVRAIGRYDNKEAAEILLHTAMTDTDLTVRNKALDAYSLHPEGGDIRPFLLSQDYRYSNLTSLDEKRMRRSLQSVASRIWKGFEFKLETPSFDWQKVVGGTELGASTGIVINNFIDIKIGALSGHAKVNIEDKAWATAHLGLLGFDIQLFLADLCYKGEIGYEVNILSEFGFDEAERMANLVDRVINDVALNVKRSIDNFMDLLSSINGLSVEDIIENFIETLKQMPKEVFDLRKIGRRLNRLFDDFTSLPPVVNEIKDFVNKIQELFQDIKHDIMGLYNAIVDTIETTLPWAWDEIRTAFNGMVEALRNIVRNPLTSVQNLGRGVARITLAVSVVLDAKDKIVEANIFARENRPYWFDFDAVFEELLSDKEDITNSLDDTIQYIAGDAGTETGVAMRYAGVDLPTIKKQALQEIWNHITEEVLEPFEHLRRLLDPFVNAYQLITDTIQNMKEAWTTLVDAYNEARTAIDSVFGAKFNVEFPRKYVKSQICGDGFWESTGRGNYQNPGIDLEVNHKQPIVAPFGGRITETIPYQQVTIKVADIQGVEIIIDNIAMHSNLTAVPEVGAGDYIGVATRTWCSLWHIHVSMRNLENQEFIDPARFKQKRKMPPPEWIETCDHYELVWRGDTLAIGSVTQDPTNENQTHHLENAPDDADLDSATFDEPSRKKKRSLGDWIDRFKDFTSSLGLGDIRNITQVFNIRMANISMTSMMSFLDENGYSELSNSLKSAIHKFENMQGQESCVRPENMDNDELRTALAQRRLSTRGTRDEMQKRIRHPDTECYGILNHITDDSICMFDANCLGFSCCVDLSLFGVLRQAVVAYIKYDPCEHVLFLGVDKWSTVISLPSIKTFKVQSGSTIINTNIGDLKLIQLIVHYDVSLQGSNFKIDLSLAMCSSLAEECMNLIDVAKNLEIPILSCSDVSNSSSAALPTQNTPLPSTALTAAEFIDRLDLAGLSEDEMIEMLDQIRDAFVAWVDNQINQVITRIFEDFLDNHDTCMRDYILDFGPYEVNIFTPPPLQVPLGWFNLVFRFGLEGYYGARFSCSLCILSMKARATITPFIGSLAWGSVGLEAGPFRVQLRLNGYLLTTELPTQAEVSFKKFPLNVKGAMDLRLIPLRVTLFGEIIFDASFKIWGKSIKIRKVILSLKIFEYSTSAINKRIFGSDEVEPDTSPPEFLLTSNQPPTEVEEVIQVSVEQVVGKDWTEPAFNIQFDVADDKSDVQTTLCIGTFKGGCNVLRDEPLGGIATLQSRALYSGVKLHFRVTSRNSQGAEASIDGSIPTYDTTPPTGRITPEFKTTSNPHILRFSIFVTDDSEIDQQLVSVGHGITNFASQVIPWENFATDSQDNVQSSNTAGDGQLSYFAVPKRGRLVHTPFERHTHGYAARCAQECLSYPITKCLGFNYDYGESGTCELMNSVEGHSPVRQSGSFHFFERLGVGQTAHIDRNDLKISHNELIFCVAYVKNILGYDSFISSEGILFDFTPPDPGAFIEVDTDMLLHEDCEEYTPAYLEQRCANQSPLPNYRFISDVSYSECTICNGHTAGNELRWTRANRMVSCNWDHIHDNETGILVYTWAVGTEPCEDNIHPHKDPHAHIHKESEWTHQGVAFPLNLRDGHYHVTLTVLNNVEFGGPFALKICHQTPYIIDTTPPVFLDVNQATYDEDTYQLDFNVTAMDELSLIQYMQVGLGRSRRDTYILAFVTVPSTTPLNLVNQLPDGVPTWVKVRAANYVNLRTITHSPRAIFTDSSPPEPGSLFMGRRNGVHEMFQHQTNELCVNWQDFYDPESGIGEFMIAFGSSPTYMDVMNFTLLSGTLYAYCIDDLNLYQNQSYFATLIAFNGATIPKNATATSDPIIVDQTPPNQGIVSDGKAGEADMIYSSSASSISVNWDNFYDAESGVNNIKVTFKRQGAFGGTSLYEEDKVPSSMKELTFHHFHLHHNDYLFSEVNVTNGAGLFTIGSSDGFLVDLTQPEMNYLVDGDLRNQDAQFTYSTNMLSANWMFSDDESGMAEYIVAIFSQTSGDRQQIYPTGSGEWITLDAGSTSWNTGEVLNLNSGQFYFTRVLATNKANLHTVADTNGVVIDTTPPEMLYVHAGVLSGESEEVIDGYVHQNNPGGIRASWKGLDPESSITHYIVGVGSSPGLDDIWTFNEIPDEDGYIQDISLNLTNFDLPNPSPLYYINVKAISGAYQESSIMRSSPIALLDEDRDGIVWDGQGESMLDDIDYQLDARTISMSFTGFESALHGIERYEWAIGNRPRYDNIMSFTEYGIIVTDERVLGLGSSGYAMISKRLTHGHTYYCTLRAITGAGNVMDVSSDGVTIDRTPPSASIIQLQDSFDITDESRVFSTRSTIQAEWRVEDTEGYITESILSVGTVPGASNIMQPIPMADNVLLDDVVSALGEGKPNFVNLMFENEVGLFKKLISAPIVIDNTPPIEGRVECPKFATGHIISCSMWGFADNESGISHFEVALGLSEGDSSVREFMRISAGSDDFSITFQSLVQYGETEVYFVTVYGFNNAGLSTRVFSVAIFIDNSPPVGYTVKEIADHESYNVLEDRISIPQTDADALCQRDSSRIHIAWDKFMDEETGIDHYEIALGTAPGATQIQGFTYMRAELSEYIFLNLDLHNVRTVFATVRGFNKAGLHSSLSSNGVHISRLSAGNELPSPLLVHDGVENEDKDFQDHIDWLGATWRLEGDPCGFLRKNWTISRVDNVVIKKEEALPEGENYGYADEISIHDKESFFVIIKATNALNHTTVLHSDGITIELEPVLPGIVRDGIISGVDLSYQIANDTLGCHWDGFGEGRVDGTFDSIVEGRHPGMDLEVGEHQVIDHYEVAIGTDRTSHRGRTAIRPFTNARGNVTWVFDNLELESESQTSIYYCTVRAFSVSTAYTEVTSNGIRVGHVGRLLQHGALNMDKYISSTTGLLLSWSGFEFTKPTLRYFWGIAHGEVFEDSLECSDIVNHWQLHQIANIEPFHDVGLNTFVSPSSLSLVHSLQYSAIVVALDESGTCDVATKTFTVDLTPPTEGHINIIDSIEMPVLFNGNDERIAVKWVGVEDLESDIDKIGIALYSTQDCSAYISNPGALVLEDILPGNATNYTFSELTLQPNSPYFVKIEVVNGAQLSINVLSNPILVDIDHPKGGQVIDGQDINFDQTFHGSTSQVSGSLIYMPANMEACKETEFHTFDRTSDLVEIVHKCMWLVPEEKQDNLHFISSQVEYNQGLLGLTLERKITEDKMNAGAVRIKQDQFYIGVYKFEARITNKAWAITAISFWDGPPGIFVSSSNFTNRPKTSNGMTIVDQGFEDDTFSDGYRLRDIIGNGFGIQMNIESAYETKLTLWGKSGGAFRTASVILDYDASDEFHLYEVAINEARDVTDIRDWDLKLYIDGRLKCTLGGIHGVQTNFSVYIGVLNKNGVVPELADEFNPPSDTALFRYISLPSSTGIMCRPFQGGENPIVQFYAGIGTEQGLVDISPYQLVMSPPIPCGHVCDDLICDPDTNEMAIQHINFTLSELNMIPTAGDILGTGDNFSEPIPQAYFLTVKALTGSGKSTVVSSNGFYIDTTPPIINSILHFDTEYDNQEPVNYQGNNHTIRVVWSAEDSISEISENWWAIGTHPGAADVQAFISTGQDQLAFNTNLLGLLFDSTTYYVTVKCVNLAGLVSYNTSDGVTVLLETPSVDGTLVEIPGTTSVGSEETNAVETNNQSNFTVAFDTPPESEQVVDIRVGAGTQPGKNDIFPSQQVGYNSSGTVSITGEGIQIGHDDPVSLNSSKGRNEIENHSIARRSTYSQLNMDPGRTVHMNVLMCNAAHKCANVPTKDILIVRDIDNITKTDDYGYINASIESDIPLGQGYTTFQITSNTSQANETYLLTGLLSKGDMLTEYKSDASAIFNPMIVNPQTAMYNIDRSLYGRVWSVSDSGFFITTLPAKPIHSHITLNFPFNKDLYLIANNTPSPTLLTYCSNQHIWVDASQSCSFENATVVNWFESTVEVNICDIDSYCQEVMQSRPRYRRQAGANDFSGSHSFIVGSVEPNYINYAPVLLSDVNIVIDEDPGIVVISLNATDPENDEFEFILDPTSSHTGSAILSAEGEMTYIPCEDCFGTDIVLIILREVRYDEIDAEESQYGLNITINPINDNPRLIVIKDGNCVNQNPYQVTLAVEEYQRDRTVYQPLDILFAAYDVDLDDVNIVYTTVENGDILVQNQATTDQYKFQNCSLPWEIRESQWHEFEEVLQNNEAQFFMLIPCNMTEDVSGKAIKWSLSSARYIPQRDFIGEDVILVSARDKSDRSLRSELLRVRIVVLANPCIEGFCVGVNTDPNCDSLERQLGFEGYRCECFSGFEGEYCEINIDDCSPNQCKDGYKCIDKVNGYECKCDSGDCKGLAAWAIALICLTVLAVLTIPIIILVCCVMLKKKRNTEKEHLLSDSSTTNLEIKNPTYDDEQVEDDDIIAPSKAPLTTNMAYLKDLDDPCTKDKHAASHSDIRADIDSARDEYLKTPPTLPKQPLTSSVLCHTVLAPEQFKDDTPHVKHPTNDKERPTLLENTVLMNHVQNKKQGALKSKSTFSRIRQGLHLAQRSKIAPQAKNMNEMKQTERQPNENVKKIMAEYRREQFITKQTLTRERVLQEELLKVKLKKRKKKAKKQVGTAGNKSTPKQSSTHVNEQDKTDASHQSMVNDGEPICASMGKSTAQLPVNKNMLNTDTTDTPGFDDNVTLGAGNWVTPTASNIDIKESIQLEDFRPTSSASVDVAISEDESDSDTDSDGSDESGHSSANGLQYLVLKTLYNEEEV